MKIALCLSGLLGGTGGRNGKGKIINPKNGYYWFYKNLIKENNVDIFFHTWGDTNNDLINLYKPKSYLFEIQKSFDSIDHKNYGFKNIIEQYQNENSLFKTIQPSLQELNEYKGLIFRSNSKWYSIYKSIELLSEYKNKNKINYDFVIISRFDVALKKKIKFDFLDKDILFLSKRTKYQLLQKESFNDLIFMGSFPIINIFKEIYPKIFNYPVDPIVACYRHVLLNNIEVENFFEHNQDILLLRDNVDLMKYDFDFIRFIKHFARRLLKNR